MPKDSSFVPPSPSTRGGVKKGAGVRLEPLPPGKTSTVGKKGGSSSPRALRSFLRNFLSDDLGSFKTEVDLREHSKDSGTVIRDVKIRRLGVVKRAIQIQIHDRKLGERVRNT